MEHRLPHLEQVGQLAKAIKERAQSLIKPSNVDALQKDFEEISLMLLELQKLNRVTYHHTRNVKAETADAKQAMDRQFLSLQNLNYERLHIEREIANCKADGSIYQRIDLIPESEFREIHPDLAPNLTDHELMLARLQFELSERERLAKEANELKAKRDIIRKDLAKSQAELDLLDKEVDSFLKSSLPIQERMNVKYTEERQQFTKSLSLPHQLYVLYEQFMSYKNVHAPEPTQYSDNLQLTLSLLYPAELVTLTVSVGREQKNILSMDSLFGNLPDSERLNSVGDLKLNGSDLRAYLWLQLLAGNSNVNLAEIFRLPPQDGHPPKVYGGKVVVLVKERWRAWVSFQVQMKKHKAPGRPNQARLTSYIFVGEEDVNGVYSWLFDVKIAYRSKEHSFRANVPVNYPENMVNFVLKNSPSLQDERSQELFNEKLDSTVNQNLKSSGMDPLDAQLVKLCFLIEETK
ncbi:hypothetical protein HDU97_009780 [Phlyctochytrium planicorne]|nr:hypothetical protein HDU97_009780 [Phlyctochytrium planicorne]